MKISQPKMQALSHVTFDECIIDLDFNNKFIDTNPTLDMDEECRFDSCHFKKVDFTKTEVKCKEFLDVIFEGCDCSTMQWSGVHFHRCIFKDCKMSGISFENFFIKNVQFQSCLMSLCSFSNGKIESSTITKSKCDEARFFNVEIKNLDLEEDDFTLSEMIETPCRQIDFSSSTIEGITIDHKSLQGMKVNHIQAIALARLLGIEVVE